MTLREPMPLRERLTNGVAVIALLLAGVVWQPLSGEPDGAGTQKDADATMEAGLADGIDGSAGYTPPRRMARAAAFPRPVPLTGFD